MILSAPAKMIVASGTQAVSSGAASGGSKVLIAKTLGYVMGTGALSLYLPIITKLYREKNADGMSLQTWWLNLIGFTAAGSYPIKRGFPFSTYVDGVVLVLQSIVALGLTSFYRGRTREFIGGMAVYVAAVVALLYTPVPIELLGGFQIAATVLSNYAQIPQIMLTFKRKEASWSWITAGLSTVGNMVRVFTTMQLTKDPLILWGHTLGAISNGILLGQIIYYSKFYKKQ